MGRRVVLVTAAAIVAAGLSWSTGRAEPPPPEPPDTFRVYTGVLDAAGLESVVATGVDRHELHAAPVAGDPGRFAVEVILSGRQAATVDGTLNPADDGTARRVTALATGVFRMYGGPGGLQEELAAQAAAHPDIAQLHVIGETVQGQDITAVRVTRRPSRTRLGARPTTVYFGAQHAREWVTPEMVRRLLGYVLDGYGSDPRVTELVNQNELWFIPVANPDGYDRSFEDGQRLWRKNVRDNDGDGEITTADGVDLNRNYPTRWGYDNEGSSPNPTSDTYRGTAPASEPETQALIGLFRRITPEFFVNYHSAAALLLYGVGWQVATPSPDDVLYEAMVGDDANPAVPGYDPDIGAELYTTNGDTDTHMQEEFGALGFTPEMSTCATASDSDPDDEWEAEDCDTDFHFPDDEDLIQAEFEKNIPFALAVAESAEDPDDPVSVVGRDAEDFRVDTFDVSWGDPQTVAVTAKRDLRLLHVQYRVNGGRTRIAFVREWEGGERYGFENDDYYAEYRAQVRGTRPGDSVEVKFVAFAFGDRRVRYTESDPFTYTVEQDTGHDVLVLANEDYTGVNPGDSPVGPPPKYVDEHVDALRASGVEPDVWDVDAKGVPHDLGVLEHYDAIVWYLGDNRLTQDPSDLETDFFGSPLPDLSVAERQQYLTIAVRDFLNAGGKLVFAGETAGYFGIGATLLGGIYYGLDGAPTEDCVVDFDPFSDCLLLADDFTQYYLGSYSRTALSASGIIGTTGPTAGATAEFGGPATVDNPIDEVGGMVVTSDVLPVDEFPQFASTAVAEYLDPAGPLIPPEGLWAAAAAHADDGYMRLARTIDLTAVTAAQAPTLEAQFSIDTEAGYDHLIVEAHPVGADDWTTLPDREGGTSTTVPTQCEDEFLVEEHPFLEHYLTLGDPCMATGTTGSWNSFTGSYNAWIPVAFDLSAYAGQQVEVLISYVTDPFTGGVGILVDDTRLVVGGATVDSEGFETGLGPWSVPGAPAGSPGNAVDWERSQGERIVTAGIVTEDTAMFSFGLEQLALPEARDAVVGAVLDYLASTG